MRLCLRSLRQRYIPSIIKVIIPTGTAMLTPILAPILSPVAGRLEEEKGVDVEVIDDGGMVDCRAETAEVIKVELLVDEDVVGVVNKLVPKVDLIAVMFVIGRMVCGTVLTPPGLHVVNPMFCMNAFSALIRAKGFSVL